jgi:nicotinamide-nucleotide amidase
MTPSADHVAAIATAAREQQLGVAVAESLTSGLMASRLGAGEESSTWFRGGVVAYHLDVKHDLLDIPEGPVVTAECAEGMARRTAELLGAQAVVAVTGVGGPDPEEGEEPGTVYTAVLVGDTLVVHRLDLAGDDPERILHETADRSLRLLAEALGAPTGSSRG